MFRDLLRKKQQLSAEECIEILKSETRGVLSVMGDNDYPYGSPINHFYNDDDGCLYFHCGKKGHRLDSIKKHSKVSFCIYNQGYRKQGEWAYNVKSVIVFGEIEIIDDLNIIIPITEKLSRKFTDDEEYIQREIKNYARNTLLLKLTPQHICGKQIKEE